MPWYLKTALITTYLKKILIIIYIHIYIYIDNYYNFILYTRYINNIIVYKAEAFRRKGVVEDFLYDLSPIG